MTITRIDAIRYARHERPAAENFTAPAEEKKPKASAKAPKRRKPEK